MANKKIDSWSEELLDDLLPGADSPRLLYLKHFRYAFLLAGFSSYGSWILLRLYQPWVLKFIDRLFFTVIDPEDSILILSILNTMDYLFFCLLVSLFSIRIGHKTARKALSYTEAAKLKSVNTPTIPPMVTGFFIWAYLLLLFYVFIHLLGATLAWVFSFFVEINLLLHLIFISLAILFFTILYWLFKFSTALYEGKISALELQ